MNSVFFLSSPHVWASSQWWVEATLAMAQRVKSDFGRALGWCVAVEYAAVVRQLPRRGRLPRVLIGRFGRFDGTAVVPPSLETLGRLKNTTESIQAELASECAGQGSAFNAVGYCRILDPNAGTSQYTSRARFSPAKLPRPSACTNHNVDGPEDRSRVDVTPARTRPRDFSTWTSRLVATCLG